MKKIMGISVIAAMAVLPMAANAARSSAIAEPANFTAGGSGDIVATTSYVQGAYQASSDRIDALITDTAVTTTRGVVTAGNSVAENLEALGLAVAGFTSGESSVGTQIQTTAKNADYTNAGMTGVSTIAGGLDYLENKATVPTTDANEEEIEYNVIDAGDNVAGNLVKLDAEIGTRQDGNYIDADNSVSQDLKALDTAIGQKQGGSYINANNTVSADLKSLDTNVKTINDKSINVSTTWGSDAVVQKRISDLPAYVDCVANPTAAVCQ